MSTPPPLLLDLIAVMMPGREVLAYVEVREDNVRPPYSVIGLVGPVPNRPDTGPILVVCDDESDTTAVTLDRAAAEQLRDALTAWLEESR